MNTLDFKKFSPIIVVIAIFALLISLFPLIVYYLAFKDFEISKEPLDWAAFGSFISGTVGIVLSFFAVIFALISIYFTTRIAKYIQDNDFNFRTEQSKKALQLTHTQSRPYPYIDLQRLPRRTSVTIQNMGLGPLIIKEIVIIYNKNEKFANFRPLFFEKLQLNTKGAQITYNSAPNHILAPNSHKSILQINPAKENNENFKSIQTALRSILKDCEIVLTYEDIFKNKFIYNKELSFLKE
jgi:hypothetical protein